MYIFAFIISLVYSSSVVKSQNKLLFHNRSDSLNDFLIDSGLWNNLKYITIAKYQKNLTIKGGNMNETG